MWEEDGCVDVNGRSEPCSVSEAFPGDLLWLGRFLDRDEGTEAEETSLEVIRGVADCFPLW